MINYSFYYTGPLIFKTKIIENDLKSIRSLCKKDKTKDHRINLAGHLDHEYLINTEKFQLIINKYLESHKKSYEHFYNANYPGKLICNSVWVNYMQKGEDNPVHIHTNCDFSSVVFLQIPSELKKERKKYIGTSKGPGSLSFEISSVSQYYIHNILVVPEEGDFFIFPWNIKHFVSSFKSEGERISVSANFVFEKI